MAHDPLQPEDAAISAAIRAGDARAFEALVRAHGGRLLAVTRRILGNEEDARDAVQDAFVSAFRARKGFQGESRVSTWLHRIAVNAALMKLRTRRRKPEQALDDLLPAFLPDGHHAQRLAAWTEAADVSLGRRETAQFVRQAIDRLPESYRTVLLLRDIEELSTDETAMLLNISANAVKIRLHRARLALRTILSPHFQEAHA